MNGISRRALSAAVFVGLMGLSSTAHAMFSTATASVMDTTPVASGAAGGFAGNDVGAMGTGLSNLNGADVFTSDTWEYVGQSDEPNTPFTNNPDDETNGTLSFALPQDGPFVISIKAANFYSLYYFDASFQGVTEIDFTTTGVAQNPGGGSPGFSHGTLYRVVPAPGAMALLGLGGLVGVRRRRG